MGNGLHSLLECKSILTRSVKGFKTAILLLNALFTEISMKKCVRRRKEKEKRKFAEIMEFLNSRIPEFSGVASQQVLGNLNQVHVQVNPVCIQ